MGHPSAGADDTSPRDLDTRLPLARAARAWHRTVSGTGYVPGTGAATIAVLQNLLYQMVAAVQATPFDATLGRRIGRSMVEQKLAAPRIVEVTMPFLHNQLPLLVGGVGAADRAWEVLGCVAGGLVEGQRTYDASAAESANNAEKEIWRQREAALQQELARALRHDPVTGLPNRGALLAHLTELIATRRGARRLGVCLLDVHGFAAVTDALGHDTDDQLRAAVGSRLSHLATPGLANLGGSFLAHLGGYRFALVVPGTAGPDDVLKLAGQASRVLEQPLPVDGHLLHVTVTAGIAEGPRRNTRPADWLRQADIAVRWAHTDGQPHRVFEPRRAAEDLQRHRLAAALPAALTRGEFVVHYQPIHRVSDQSIIGCEALARWQHPGLPLLGPDAFLVLAEQTGLIGILGQLILDQACTQAAAWHRQGRPLTVSVQVSPAQLADPGIVGAVHDVLTRTGLPAHQLQLEITEAAITAGHQDALRRMSDLGIRLAIDDFGTGSSALTGLPRFPGTQVKLAPTFLTNPTTRDDAAEILLRDTIALLHHLGITVTAEGVTTAAQHQHLHQLGCDYGQGPHYSHPMPAHALTDLLQTAAPDNPLIQ